MGKYYKHPKYGIVFCDKPYLTPPCRICWPYLSTPRDPMPVAPGQPQGQPSYEATLLFPKDSPAHRNWLKMIDSVFADMLKTFNAGNRVTIANVYSSRDGDDQKYDKEKYPYYKGQNLVIARSTKQPTFTDNKKQPCDPATIIGGCLVCAVITPKITSHGATYGLEIVQLWKDDNVRFAGSSRRGADYISMLSVADEMGAEDGGNGADVSAEEAADEALSEAPPLPKKQASSKKSSRSNIADLL